ncbi:MAG TPA: GntR family transcriptional regulator [Hyphomicrobiaceae bacterium]|nr:GntR family transcriptional regulator [Hyphomicrobiaceae bacterium]
MTRRKPSKTTASTAPGEPKHKLIANRLLAQIEAGTWTPGAQIPSEDQLAIDTGASLGTIRRALGNLVEMGVLERHHGKGTFVSGARALERQLRHFRFVAEGSTKLLPVYFRVLDVAQTSDRGPWQAALGASSDIFVRVSRIVSVNSEFDIFNEVYLPKKRFAMLLDMADNLDGVSIRDLLAERFNAPTLTTHQYMRCEPLPPRVARHIGVAAGQYGMVLTVCAMSYRKTPITWQRVFIPPSDRALEISCVSNFSLVG